MLRPFLALLMISAATAATPVIDVASVGAGGMIADGSLVATLGGPAGTHAVGQPFLAVGFAAQIANRAPSAVARGSLLVPVDGSVAVSLDGSDPDGDGLVVAITSAPLHGGLSGSGAARIYAPHAGFSGQDGFAFRVGDGADWSAPVWVAITVGSAHPAPPVIVGGLTVTTPLGVPFSYAIQASGAPTQFAAAPLPAGLTLDPLRGVIIGVPTVAGATDIAIAATNAAGNGLATLVLTVVNDPAAALLDVAEIEFTGTVTGAAPLRMTRDGMPIPVVDGRWSTTLPLPGSAAVEDLRIEASDGRGRTTTIDLRTDERPAIVPPAPAGSG